MDTVHQHLVTLLTEKFDVPVAEIRPQATPADLDLDSLARVELLVTLQEHWGVTFPDEDAAAELTIAELADHVGGLLGRQPSERPAEVGGAAEEGVAW
jgi:acyl carrier protein